MPRPACPLCGDHFSVVRVSALYRHASPADAACWQPPPAPAIVHRWSVTAIGVGLVVFAATGFAVFWLCLALCGAVLVELFHLWDGAEEHRAYRAARARWEATYYCTTHDSVFVAGASETSPREYAKGMPWAPPMAATGSANLDVADADRAPLPARA